MRGFDCYGGPLRGRVGRPGHRSTSHRLNFHVNRRILAYNYDRVHLDNYRRDLFELMLLNRPLTLGNFYYRR